MTEPDPTAPVGVGAVTVAGAGRDDAPRSTLDRLARRLLRVEGADPRALFAIKGSLWISAVRCVITYALIPALSPLVVGLDVLATPLSLLLSFVAVGFAVHSLRRVWLADWAARWAYTTFIGVVLVLLAVVIAFDLGRLLG